MPHKSPLASRYGALVLGLNALGHALVASDLLLNYFAPTPEITALWASPAWVKALWVVTTVAGLLGAVALYRSPLAGFALSLAVTVCLYFASMGLWQELKGTMWIAVAANLLALRGTWQARWFELGRASSTSRLGSTQMLGRSDEPGQTHLNTSWPRFLLVIVLLSLPALLFLPLASGGGSQGPLIATAFYYTSICVFLVLGLLRLSRANNANPIPVDDFVAITRHLIGPVAPAIAWFAMTLLITFVAFGVLVF